MLGKQKKRNGKWVYLFLILCFLILISFLVFYYRSKANKNADIQNWPEYNGGPDRNHYSSLAEITSENIGQLEKVWEYSSGGADSVKNQTQIQCNPIIIDGVLYGVSAGSQAFALNAATGTEIWKTSFTDETYSMTSRGVTYYAAGKNKIIFFGFGHLLYALDAATGKPMPGFGMGGKVNLKEGLLQPGADDYVVYNTPGVIFEDLLITGTRVSEGPKALPGDIRAFNANTGKLVWTFQTIPGPGEWGSDTWPENARENNGGANSWMGMAIDRENGIVFAPTGSASFDFYGGNRHGSNLFANCLLALDARTGIRKWHFQVVHHDIWDRDLPAPPNLFTIKKNQEQVHAVAQVTKQGYVFVFNRITGEPVFPIVESPVQSSDVPGELTFPTQPIPTKPLPFTRQSFTIKDINNEVSGPAEILKLLHDSRTGSAYIPITKKRTIIFPGTDGGAQWGGAAMDPGGIMYVPAKEIPVFTSLEDAPAEEALTSSKKLYQLHCGSCHGADFVSNNTGTYPSLVDVAKRMSSVELHQMLQKGRGMMPAFTQLSQGERDAIVSYLESRKDTVIPISTASSKRKSPYVHTGYNRWYDRNGYPVNTPPWGTLTAINLQNGERLWQIPLGEFTALSKKGVAPTGTDNYGGPLVTGSGIIFIAATPDQKFRAFDKHTGQLLWQTILPAPGYASPSTYAVDGIQYIVIACGGGKLRSKSGDKYVAYALKK